jgi:hypothetical protein
MNIDLNDVEVFSEKRDENGQLIGFEKAYTSKDRIKNKKLISIELKELQKELKKLWYNLLLGEHIGFKTLSDERSYYKEQYEKYEQLLNEKEILDEAPIYPELYMEDGARNEIIDFVRVLTSRKK